eukprot:5858597-Prorocentrum_lima.AAC.1
MAGPIKPISCMCTSQEGCNKAPQFGEMLPESSGQSMPAHSSKGILGIEGHHHGFRATQVDPCLAPRACGKLAVASSGGYSVAEGPCGRGKEDPTPST